MIYGIRFISSLLFHSEKDPKDILSNLNIENPQLNLRSATNFVAKKDKAVWKDFQWSSNQGYLLLLSCFLRSWTMISNWSPIISTPRTLGALSRTARLYPGALSVQKIILLGNAKIEKHHNITLKSNGTFRKLPQVSDIKSHGCQEGSWHYHQPSNQF